MSWLDAVRGLLPPGDPRSEAEIDADLDDEFAFHVEQIRRELLDAGVDPQEAQSAALARFGDVARIKRRCRRVALEERIMLQRVNLVLMEPQGSLEARRGSVAAEPRRRRRSGARGPAGHPGVRAGRVSYSTVCGLHRYGILG